MSFEDCIYKPICKEICNKNFCIRYSEMNYMIKSSNIPKSRQKFNSLIPDTCDVNAFIQLAEIRDNIEEFVSSGKQLYLYSKNCGNGKTTWSIKLMLQYFNEKWAGNGFTKRGLFISVPTFLGMCKAVISSPDTNFEELKKDIMNVDLVIWDDIASEKLSAFDFGILSMYISQREVDGKSNIYTGNVAPENLSDYVGLRLSSRINYSTKIELKGGDHR